MLSKYQEREKYLVIDNIIVDLVNKKILTYDNSDKYIENLNDISKIEVIKIPDTSKKRITTDILDKFHTSMKLVIISKSVIISTKRVAFL